MPRWAVSKEIVNAADELLKLHRNANIALRQGVSKSITTAIAKEAAYATTALWQTAANVRAVASQQESRNEHSSRLQERMAQEAENLRKLGTEARNPQEGLQEATFGGNPDLESMLVVLRMHGELARGLS